MSAYLDTEYSACSAEFSPFHSNLLALGLYQITPDEDNACSTTESPATKRLGRCLLFDTSQNTFNELCRLEMPAVLDMKWGTLGQFPSLAVANAEGGVSLHRLDEEKVLKDHHVVQYASRSTLSLSIDWSNRKEPNFVPELVVSNSAGKIYILGGPTLEDTVDEWDGHDYEPWIAAWDCWCHQTVWTGGDDSLLKVWDRRQGFARPAVQNKRFDSGVTAIQSHVHDANLVAVGSYDAQLRVFDKRNMLKPLAQHAVGGGVWRVKWNPLPSRRDDVLVACMHDGFKVVQVQREGDQPRALETAIVNKSHASLAYGADWERDGQQIASASFYDHAARLWDA